MTRFHAVLVIGVAVLCCALPVLGGEIHRAIETGDVARVKQILESNTGALNEKDDGQFRELPLHIAATTGNVEIARLLLDAGADIDAGDADNSTALGVAAMRRHAEMVDLLIARGADVNRRDRKADCPLSFAAYGRDEAIIQKLLDAGADIYYRAPGGETLLHVAAPRGLKTFVTYLLDHGAEIDALAHDGGTPLGYAALRGQAEIVRLLLERGANPNPTQAEQLPPLVFTTWQNQAECARILLEHGAKVDQPFFGGETILMRVAETGTPEMTALLIEHGADVDHVNDTGETPLVKASAAGHADRVEPLLAANADPNLGHDSRGRSALQLAALGGHVDVARMLLARGANPNPQVDAADTPLQLARYYGNDDVAALLLENAAGNKGSKSVDRSLAAIGKVGEGEAVCWFLGHSGWAVKTRDHLLVIDYFVQDADPTKPGLCNGRVNAAEIAGENVVVFASHQHPDHFAPVVFEWKQQVPNIAYFLGCEPQNAPPHESLAGRMEKTVGGLKVTTIPATDAGVGMVIEVDGVTIFHAGDHANGRTGLAKEFTDEIDFLAGKGIRPDICFLGVRGCSLGTPDQ
ncbi:MAG: uncharacterized protein H6Q78_988, partial [Candidatus Krumholzibacteriota bacterium]|nr:uncharacterized protein [Candidatus Krumholzibacteriota bacterium]